MSLDYPGLAMAEVVTELDEINVPASTGALSITGWINPDAVGVLLDQVIIAKSPSTGNSGPFKVQVENSGSGNVLRFIINDNDLLGASAIVASVWTFFACIYDGADKFIFLNAVQDATEADAAGDIETNTDSVRLAAVFTSSNRREFDGLLADIRVYTRALSLAEIQTIFTLLGVDNIVHGLHWRWFQRERGPGQTATVAGSIKDFAGNDDGDPLNSPIYQAGILR